MRKLLFIPLVSVLLAGCVTNPDGSSELTPEGQQILETSTRIAVRHFVADSPRAAERIANVRWVVAKLQKVTSAETTLGALEQFVRNEINGLPLSDVDRADALDLLGLLAVSLESRLGDKPLAASGVVQVNQVLTLILEVLPPA